MKKILLRSLGSAFLLAIVFSGNAYAQAPLVNVPAEMLEKKIPEDLIRYNRCNDSKFLNDNPDADNCCKNCGAAIGLNESDMKCCLDSGATKCSCVDKVECQIDTDCDDKDDCTTDKCLGIPGIDITGSKGSVVCKHEPIKGCVSKDCGKLYKLESPEYQCCKDGFSESNPEEWKCCLKNAEAKEPTRTAEGKPVPCSGDCPECRCPKIPKIDCEVIGDSKMKECCYKKDGLLWFVMDSCIPDGPEGEAGCTNLAEHITNSGVFQQCCLINNGVINGDINMCNNNWIPGEPGGTTTGGGTPTTPEGSASALTCSVAQVGAPVEGKFAITYTVPGSAGPVVSATLTQLSGSQIKVEGESEPADFGSAVTAPKAMSTKTISDPNNPPSFTVYAPTPKSMTGEWKAPFEVKVSLATLDGDAGSALCTEDHFLHAEGTGCGCAMTATLTTREQVAAYAVMAFLLMVPLAALRTARKASKK